ncbi:FkbM family methyltransferase [Microvirga terrae]|uniref:FkbM family methyltransferase n=1 Tax=Microvirga terrae TaxID=2740529 RepID=A0ABY5RMF7_9HYPH|nr:FkbM family methyltransferase [Microvirga terrae]UVF18401.1 FkbM family methyltransferase [Microvirga terrae]
MISKEWIPIGVRRAIPNPIKQLPWRVQWMRSTSRYKDDYIKTVSSLIGWTIKEICSSELRYVTSGGMELLTMPNNISAFQDQIAGGFETNLLMHFRRALSPGSVVCDVGGNIGVYALEAARVVGQTGKVISYEAHPYTFDFLTRNINLHRFDNVIPLNVAVGDTEGSIFLNYGQGNSGSTHVALNQEGIEVPMVTLDESLRRHGIVYLDYLKIDVEGYELPVLRGALNIIKQSPSLIIQIEVDQGNLSRFGNDTNELVDFLLQLGFEPRGVAPDGSTTSVNPYTVKYGDLIWRRPE